MKQQEKHQARKKAYDRGKKLLEKCERLMEDRTMERFESCITG